MVIVICEICRKSIKVKPCEKEYRRFCSRKCMGIHQSKNCVGDNAYRWIKNKPTVAVHHVNYNKNCLCNDIKCEFVPLCISCHSKTNGKRIDWEKHILDKLSIAGVILNE